MSTSLTTVEKAPHCRALYKFSQNNMEEFNMNYSDKNIPIPSQQDYKIHLISKTEKFIKRIRWEALEFLGKLDSTEKETYGFRSRNCPPIAEEVANFENNLMMLIKNT